MNNHKNTEQYRKEIKNWFASGKDFDQGFSLFVRFSHNRALAIQLARKRTQGKLEYELEKLAIAPVLIERPVMNIAVVRTVVVKAEVAKKEIVIEVDKTERKFEKAEKVLVNTEGRIDYEKLNEEQKALFDANRDKYKEMRSWHEKMKLAKTDQERADARAMIIELDDAIRANWQKFDASFTGEVSENFSPEVDPVKAVGNARSYLSKNLSKLESLTGKKLDGLKEKVKERYDVIIAANQVVDDETTAKLVAHGIIVE